MQLIQDLRGPKRGQVTKQLISILEVHKEWVAEEVLEHLMEHGERMTKDSISVKQSTENRVIIYKKVKKVVKMKKMVKITKMVKNDQISPKMAKIDEVVSRAFDENSDFGRILRSSDALVP